MSKPSSRIGQDSCTVLVYVEQFPNRIQPWILNSIEQVIRHGADVRILSAPPDGQAYAAKVDELRLRARTLYLKLGSPFSVAGVIVDTLRPWSRAGRLARRGLGRLLRSRMLFRGPLRRLMNRLIKAPAFGLSDITVVHTHSMVTAYEAIEVAEVLDVPLVHTFHGLLPVGVPELPETRRKTLFDHVTVCLVNTCFAQDQLMGLGCPEEKIHILPQGIPVEEFPFSPQSLKPGEALRILTVGRLHPDKGHRYALEAVRELVAGGSQVEYRIVGSGPEEERLKAMSRELGIQSQVEFLGSIDDEHLRDEYARAHVFVLPSVRDESGRHEETQGVVIQEAQASGKIVVATRTGGIPECVDDGVSAFLVPERDPAAIARQLKDIVDQPERWAGWQRLGREWVEAHFDVRLIGDRLWELYQGVAGQRKQ